MDLPDPGIELGSSALQVDSLPAELPGWALSNQVNPSKRRFRNKREKLEVQSNRDRHFPAGLDVANCNFVEISLWKVINRYILRTESSPSQ